MAKKKKAKRRKMGVVDMNLSLQRELITIQKRNIKHLLTLPNVVGVGVGYKTKDGKLTRTPAVIVNVKKKLPGVQLTDSDTVPMELDGYSTDVFESGEIKALKLRTDKWRPAPGGVSIGHYNITAGTLGGLVEKNGEIYINSNNHVLADSNNANIGDPVYQPGPYDGGTQIDTIAPLAEFIPIDFGGGGGGGLCPFASAYAGVGNGIAKFFRSSKRLQVQNVAQAINRVDAALAGPVELDTMVRKDVLDIGIPKGTIDAFIGMDVIKSGRTTGIMTGTVTQINATVIVGYGGGLTATFEGQIVTTCISQGGDSGSWLFQNHTELVTGLLFAGSDTTTIHGPIADVTAGFGCTIVT